MASETVDKARGLLVERRQELSEELAQIERALKNLSSNGRSATRKPRKSSGTKTTGTRAKRGEREGQLLASIKRNPNYKAADHAKEMGVSAAQVHNLVSKLVKEKKLRKTPKGALKLV